jgi:hypothetical protein
MKITALEIVKSWCSNAHYTGENCRGTTFYRVYGKEMNTLLSKYEIKEFWEYIKKHKTLYKQLTKDEQLQLSMDLDNCVKQTGNCGTCFKCKIV